MATLGSPTRSPRTRRTFARKCERICCNTLTYFPLVFVYGLTTWAVWVCVHIGLIPSKAWTGRGSNFLAVFLYIMLNWSYTTAVFTNPGSPTDSHGGYSALPTSEQPAFSSFTVKSSGEIRFCKKCQAKKPDRAHHCSTCKRCVLKMDHHCPWLATCVGLHNYKAFILFLTYTSLFCWTAFAISATWTVSTIFNEAEYIESYLPVNFIMLAVLSGIIGLVLTGFTGWHIYLTLRGYTTIEKLEKTRYLSPIKRTLQYQPQDRNYISSGRPSISDQLHEIHANALPGVLRPEEGESRSPSPTHSHSQPGISLNTSSSPAQQSLLRSYADLESARDHDRYDNYLDEIASDSLPHAFDLGMRKNTIHIFGPRPLLWALPIRTTTGDGWLWEPSPKWLMARERIKKEREAQHRAQKERERAAGWGVESPGEENRIPKPGWRGYAGAEADQEPDGRYLTTSNGVSAVRGGRRSPGKADSVLGRWPGSYVDDGTGIRPLDGDAHIRRPSPNGVREEGTPLRTLDRRRMKRPPTDEELLREDDDDDADDDYDTSSDEQDLPHARRVDRKQTFERITGSSQPGQTQNWNDLPDGFLDNQRSSKAASAKTAKAQQQQKSQGKEWDAWSPR